MEKTSQIHLTEGPILNTLTRLSLPIMASSFLSTAYSITDMAWIGVLGSKAVAGVGVGGMYVWLSSGLVSLARMGGQVHVAQCVGRGDREEAGRFAAGAIQLTVLFALAFAAVCLLFTDPLLSFFALEDSLTYRYAREYTQVTCGLIVFSYMTQTLNGLFTAQGDSKTPFLANLTGLAINMVFDPILILGIGPFPRMEVLGAAAATVSAQAVVMLVMLLSLGRKKAAENVIRRVKLFGRTPGRIWKQIFRDGRPHGFAGFDLLYDFHGAYPDGFRVRRGCGGHPENGRADRIHLLEYGGRLWRGSERVCGAELRGQEAGPDEEGLPDFF